MRGEEGRGEGEAIIPCYNPWHYYGYITLCVLFACLCAYPVFLTERLMTTVGSIRKNGTGSCG